MPLNEQPNREKEIFEQALDLLSPEERAGFLKGACGNDAQLRQRVEALLRAHAEATGFLPEQPCSAPTSVSPTEKPGDRIGRYKLLQKLGEGGAGVVYMAEQEEPVRRRVALKVIKLGMDTRSVIARFEAERQALALMDHPNIAKVLDAGATESPHPVSGHPLPSDGRGPGGIGANLNIAVALRKCYPAGMKDLNLLDEEWEFLTGFLPEDWREQARRTGALRRARGIANADCLLQLILMHTATGLSLRQTVVRAREQSLANISDVALLKRLRSSEAWLRSLTSHLTEINQMGIVKQLSPQRRIRVVDATTVEEQGGAGTNGRVHYTLCLPDLSCDFFELTDEKGGETYRRIPVQPGDLLLADRGYSNAAGVRAVAEAGGDVLVRWNSFSFPLQAMDGKPFEALKELSKLPQRGCREWKVSFTQEGQRYTGRLCAIRKGAVATARAQKKLRRQARKKQKQVNEEALKLAGFILVFTTVSPKVLSTEEVLELYRVRWQIELRFKHLKSLLGLGCLPKYDEQSCRAWIQAKLLCGLLIERLMREAKFFFPWGYRLPSSEPLAGVHRSA